MRKSFRTKSFKVYPEYQTIYFKVEITADKETYRDMIREWELCIGEELSGLNHKNSSAVTRVFDSYSQKTGHKSPFMGVLIFLGERINPVVIAHEAIHASIFYSLRVGINQDRIFFGDSKETQERYKKEGTPFDTAHERFCMIQTNIMEQILAKLPSQKYKEKSFLPLYDAWNRNRLHMKLQKVDKVLA